MTADAGGPDGASGKEKISASRLLVLTLIVALAIAGVLTEVVPRYAPGLLRFEHAMADVRTSILSDRLPSQHPHVAVVGVTEQSLNDLKVRLPIDRHLLARLVDAADAAGAKVIGLDLLFYRTVPADNEDLLIDALKRARAKVVLAAADERLGLTQAQVDQQLSFFAQTGRPAGYVNLATERDWVVRFKAQPAPGSVYPRSFARLLAESADYRVGTERRRIAWLREPLDGSDTFLTIPADVLVKPGDDPLVQAARAGLKDKIVIIGSLLPDVDQHLTPLTSLTHDKMPGAIVHAHIVAETTDGRSVGQVEVDSLVLRLGLVLLAGLGFLIGWSYRLKRKGILLGSLATVAILVLDTIAFWQWRIILPIVLALLAWFMGELSGHVLGRVLAPGQARWFKR